MVSESFPVKRVAKENIESSASAQNKLSLDAHSDQKTQIRSIDSQTATINTNILPSLTITETESKPSTNLLQQNIDQLALDLHDAKNRAWGGVNILGVQKDDPDKAKIWSILEPLTTTDKQRLCVSYEHQYGHSLLADLKEKLGTVDGARLEALLKRQDGQSDEAGQIHVALARLQELGQKNTMTELNPSKTRISIEQDIGNTVAALSSADIAGLKEKYHNDYDRDLLSDLKNDTVLSEETKHVLNILLIGAERRTDSDYVAMANLGLASHRPDIFQAALRDSTASVREKLLAAMSEQMRIPLKVGDEIG